ncbi:hypothetical protein B0H63DRAFT_522558 [Podospora didyma]|uniref:Uncharacterized protein n=1 Tax=Podospora didyma TaxID=330526 RepID=A0AAE0NPB3_9PEZI|nr:hypothetical protein B0H63DRAFT_522558 [Podospora didyma]
MEHGSDDSRSAEFNQMWTVSDGRNGIQRRRDSNDHFSNAWTLPTIPESSTSGSTEGADYFGVSALVSRDSGTRSTISDATTATTDANNNDPGLPRDFDHDWTVPSKSTQTPTGTTLPNLGIEYDSWRFWEIPARSSHASKPIIEPGQLSHSMLKSGEFSRFSYPPRESESLSGILTMIDNHTNRPRENDGQIIQSLSPQLIELGGRASPGMTDHASTGSKESSHDSHAGETHAAAPVSAFAPHRLLRANHSGRASNSSSGSSNILGPPIGYGNVLHSAHLGASSSSSQQSSMGRSTGASALMKPQPLVRPEGFKMLDTMGRGTDASSGSSVSYAGVDGPGGPWLPMHEHLLAVAGPKSDDNDIPVEHGILQRVDESPVRAGDTPHDANSLQVLSSSELSTRDNYLPPEYLHLGKDGIKWNPIGTIR